MKEVVCSLFEGHYHLGLAALCNSLVTNGFQGEVHVGYRGALPPWANGSPNGVSGWPTYPIPQSRVSIVFHKLDTKAHLTNYKPQFMLRLLDETTADQIAYFDPDIVVKCPWTYVSKWISSGIALCEDVNSPIPTCHPRRLSWIDYYSGFGRKLAFTTSEYANGGFVGVRDSERSFLQTWNAMQDEMAQDIGGLDKSMFIFHKLDRAQYGPTYMFNKSDQDALNAAIGQHSDLTFAFSGKDAMDFAPGGFTFSHSLGPEKPWIRKLLASTLRGRPPTPTDRVFWDFASQPIPAFPPSTANRKKRLVKFCSFVGRFYRNG